MRSPLRFCMITTFYPPYNFGGDGIFVHRLSNELARLGHKVDVIHCRDSYRLLAHRAPAQTYTNHPNVTVHSLRSRFGALSPLVTQQTGSPLLKVDAIRAILSSGFDVIHYHNISLIGGPKILEYGRAIKLYTMHEYWLVCPMHTLFRFNRAACTHADCLLCSLMYGRPPQWWRYTGLLKRAVRHVDAFMAPSRFCKDAHLRRGLDAPIIHLPLFVPAATSTPQPADASPEEAGHLPYFLFVGRLEKLKGLHTLLPVFQRYARARLLIAGTGGDEQNLRRLAEGCNRIEFLGQQTAEQLRILYREATAVVVPSICYETFSLAAIEAFQQQTPVVVRNQGALPELIRESGGGLVYDTNEQLHAALDRLLDRPEERRRLGESGHDAYMRQWTAEAYMARYFGLIDELAARRPGPG